MARIRTTKPEFFTSEQVMNLSIFARFAFLGMWNFCDDGGNHPASPKTLKAEVFPSDDVTSIEVQGYVDEMLEQGLLALYEAGGKQYWHVTGWHHQRIDKPTIKHPPFPGNSTPSQRPVEEPSTTTPGVLAEPSPSTTGGLTPGVEGIGVEGIGMEGINTPQPPKGGGRRSRIDPDEEPEGFATWYALYRRKDAKRDAIAAWRQLDPNADLQETMLAALRRWQWNADRTKIPLPASWIRGGRWKDEAVATIARSEDSTWWREAGFDHVAEAQNARCHVGNYREFRDGKRIDSEAHA